MMTPAGEPITARKEGVMGVERDVSAMDVCLILCSVDTF